MVATKKFTKEVWENTTVGSHFVIKFDDKGNERHKEVRPNGKVELTTEERVVNSELAASSSLDIFKNGVLRPVRLLDSADAEEIAANPNLKSEDDLKGMFGLKLGEFRGEIAAISNPSTLERLSQLAEDEALGASAAQEKAIKGRLEQIAEKSSLEKTDEIRSPRAVTPR